MVTRSGQTINTVDQTRKVDNSRSSKSKNKRKQTIKHLQRNEFTFLDMDYWKREQVCCGIIFRNYGNNMVLIDRRLYTPCSCRKRKQEEQKIESDSKAENELSDKMEVETLSSLRNETDKNNNLSSDSNVENEEEKIEIMTVNIPVDLNDLNAGNDDQINELVVVNINSSSGISSDGSDVSSITEEEEVEDESNDNPNLISDHDLIAKNMLHANRSFGVL